ncbi:flavoprotein MioC [Vibrio astriarenae]|nr:flavoprotein MioC [Vibrio sp. C7]
MIHIITGSTLGGAEYVGDHLSDILQQHNLETQIHNQPSAEEIENSGIWLIITSTHGAGEYLITSSLSFSHCKIRHHV